MNNVKLWIMQSISACMFLGMITLRPLSMTPLCYFISIVPIGSVSAGVPFLFSGHLLIAKAFTCCRA